MLINPKELIEMSLDDINPSYKTMLAELSKKDDTSIKLIAELSRVNKVN
jgi:hypothetical protein